jgi:hypothetical protein
MKHIEFRKKGKIIGPYCAGAAFTILLHIICEQRRNGTGTVPAKKVRNFGSFFSLKTGVVQKHFKNSFEFKTKNIP